jgi:hypothetical protein
LRWKFTEHINTIADDDDDDDDNNNNNKNNNKQCYRQLDASKQKYRKEQEK